MIIVKKEFEDLPSDEWHQLVSEAETIQGMGLHLHLDVIQLAKLIYNGREEENEDKEH